MKPLLPDAVISPDRAAAKAGLAGGVDLPCSARRGNVQAQGGRTGGARRPQLPVKDIERRFGRSLHNLLIDYSQTVNACQCFLNITPAPLLIFEQQGEERNVVDRELYQQLLNEAGL